MKQLQCPLKMTKKTFPLQLIRLMEEIRLTSWGWQFIPLFLGIVYIPGGGRLGFLNHQPVSLRRFFDPGFGPTEESNRLQQEFQHHSMPGNPIWDPCPSWANMGWWWLMGLGWMGFFSKFTKVGVKLWYYAITVKLPNWGVKTASLSTHSRANGPKNQSTWKMKEISCWVQKAYFFQGYLRY